jgi:hypothetical protein
MDYVFEPPTNTTNFFDMLGYFNNLTDVGAGGLFWTIMLVVLSGMLFLMMKAYSTGKAMGITFITSFFIALLFKIMGWVNNYVLTVTVLLAIFGIYLLKEDSNRY